MSFRVRFEAESSDFDTRLSRRGAIDWLRSRGVTGETSSETMATTELEDLDDDRLATVLSRATFILLDEIALRHGRLVIRHEPETMSRAST